VIKTAAEADNHTITDIPLMEEIESLITAFSSKNGWKRRKARLALVDIGKPAVPYLIKAMKNSKSEVRWEVVKTLGAISDRRSGPILVRALIDKKFEIRWLAAEGLIALKFSAVKPLLKALIKKPESPSGCPSCVTCLGKKSTIE
jgi:HEAT repeat protein